MARVPLTAYQANTGKLVLNAESVGLNPEQFYQLCRDKPDLRIEFTPFALDERYASACHSLNRVSPLRSFRLLRWSLSPPW
jgi:hypothetical protein